MQARRQHKLCSFTAESDESGRFINYLLSTEEISLMFIEANKLVSIQENDAFQNF